MNTNQINFTSEPSFVPAPPAALSDAFEHDPNADELGKVMR